jgi:hypothetical protein
VRLRGLRRQPPNPRLPRGRAGRKRGRAKGEGREAKSEGGGAKEGNPEFRIQNPEAMPSDAGIKTAQRHGVIRGFRGNPGALRGGCIHFSALADGRLLFKFEIRNSKFEIAVSPFALRLFHHHGTILVAGSLQGPWPAAPMAATRNQRRWPLVRPLTVALLLVTTRLAVQGPVPLVVERSML